MWNTNHLSMKKEKINIPGKELNFLYINKKMSTMQIAKLYKCNSETIRRKLIEYSIQRRFREIKIKIPKKELERLYNKKKMSTMYIAKRYRCSQWTIRSNLIKYNIKLRSCADFLKWKSPANQIEPKVGLSSELSYILGVLLGDAWTYRYKNNYFIGLDTKDYIFNKSFCNSIKKIGLNPNLFKKSVYWRTIASSKIFYFWFENLKFDEIEKIALYDPAAFLRGVYESEGCLSINHDKKTNKDYLILIIVSCEKNTIDLTKSLIEKLGLHPRLNLRKPPYPKKPIWVLNLGKQKEIGTFLKIVNPCIKNSPAKGL